MTERDDTATVQFKLRMREKLRRQLEESSIYNDTSINSEIVDRLERSLGEPLQISEAVGGKGNARLVRAVLDAMRAVTADGAEENTALVKHRLCAALVGVAQAVSGVRAENLLNELALDDVWRIAAGRAVSRHENVHEFVADVLVVNPENEAAVAEAELAAAKFRRPSVTELLNVQSEQAGPPVNRQRAGKPKARQSARRRRLVTPAGTRPGD